MNFCISFQLLVVQDTSTSPEFVGLMTVYLPNHELSFCTFLFICSRSTFTSSQLVKLILLYLPNYEESIGKHLATMWETNPVDLRHCN